MPNWQVLWNNVYRYCIHDDQLSFEAAFEIAYKYIELKSTTRFNMQTSNVDILEMNIH